MVHDGVDAVFTLSHRRDRLDDFQEKIQKVHFERVKPYLRKQVWPKVLKFSRENLPEKWQLSERVVEKVTREFRKRGGERVVISRSKYI